MSRKRRNTSSPEGSPSPQRQRTATTARPLSPYDSDASEDVNETPQLDQEAGQTGAFPGLGRRDAGEVFYGPAQDGIDYLKMVRLVGHSSLCRRCADIVYRSEARGVPSLLSVERKQSDEQDDNDAEVGGYWEDGAYTAMPATSTMEGSRDPPAQARYYESLLSQFRLLQATLRCTPPLAAVQNLGSTRPISFPPNSENACTQWRLQIEEKDPDMVQMACMDAESASQLLSFLSEYLKPQPRPAIGYRLGAWLWAVLAKCPDRGMMMSEEISKLRDLARVAEQIWGWTVSEMYQEATPNKANQRDESDTAEDSATATTETTRMACEMVFTIVGEVYGQRDILDMREGWLRPLETG